MGRCAGVRVALGSRQGKHSIASGIVRSGERRAPESQVALPGLDILVRLYDDREWTARFSLQRGHGERARRSRGQTANGDNSRSACDLGCQTSELRAIAHAPKRAAKNGCCFYGTTQWKTRDE